MGSIPGRSSSLSKGPEVRSNTACEGRALKHFDVAWEMGHEARTISRGQTQKVDS